jgi:hypothetical protein
MPKAEISTEMFTNAVENQSYIEELSNNLRGNFALKPTRIFSLVFKVYSY